MRAASDVAGHPPGEKSCIESIRHHWAHGLETPLLTIRHAEEDDPDVARDFIDDVIEGSKMDNHMASEATTDRHGRCSDNKGARESAKV